MAQGTITFTGNTGPGRAVTALILTLTDVVQWDMNRRVWEVFRDGNKVAELDLVGLTAITVGGVSTGIYTVTMT